MRLFPHQVNLSLSRSKLSGLLSYFLGQANQSAPSDALPLWIGGHLCGSLRRAAVETLRASRSVRLHTHTVHIGDELTSLPALNETLAEIALALKAAGQAPGWRDELLDVWSEQNQSIAGIESGVVRPLGLVTKAVHLNGLSADGGIWVARRSLTKATDPGVWDTLVGGLVGYQEDPEIALIRESDEEAGLDAPQISQRTSLRKITRMHRQVKEGFQAEDVLTSECVLESGVTPQNRDGEVMEIACLAPDTLMRMLGEDAFTIEASIVLAEDLLRRSVG